MSDKKLALVSFIAHCKIYEILYCVELKISYKIRKFSKRLYLARSYDISNQPEKWAIGSKEEVAGII